MRVLVIEDDPQLCSYLVKAFGEIGATVCFLTALMHMPLANVTAILQSLPLAVTLAGCSSGPGEEVKLGGISLVEVIDGLGARTHQVLQGLRRGDSPETVAAELAAINTDYDDLIYHAWKLPDKGQQELAKRARQQQSTVRDLIWAVEGSPLQRTLNPALAEMLDKVEILMVTPYKKVE